LMACATKGLSDEDVAAVAHKWSHHAEERAFWTGFRDYCAAYHPNLRIMEGTHPSQAKEQDQHP
jgi:hypothetical protein